MRWKTRVSASVLIGLLAVACSNVPNIATKTFRTYFTFDNYASLETVSKAMTLEDGTVTTDGKVYLQRKSSGEATLLTTNEQFGEHFYAEGGAFSPDGGTVFVNVDTENNWAIYAVALNTGEALLIAEDQTVLNGELMDILGRSLVVSPDGRKLAFRASRTVPLTDPIARSKAPSPFTNERDLYVIDSSTQLSSQSTGLQVNRMSQQGEASALFPEFTENGQLISSMSTTYDINPEVRSLQALQGTPTFRHSDFCTLE